MHKKDGGKCGELIINNKKYHRFWKRICDIFYHFNFRASASGSKVPLLKRGAVQLEDLSSLAFEKVLRTFGFDNKNKSAERGFCGIFFLKTLSIFHLLFFESLLTFFIICYEKKSVNIVGNEKSFCIYKMQNKNIKVV